MEQPRLKLLKTLRLFDRIPEKQLAALGEFLKPVSLADGQVLFEEGAPGGSLFFVADGQIRIAKRLSGGQYKDLSLMAPGDCFGEMQLAETAVRSARASAVGAAQVFELARHDLDRWLKSNPDLAIGFFTELVQVQSQRLRRTSTELALLCDLSSLLLEPVADGKLMMRAVLERVTPHLTGEWSSSAYYYNRFNEEFDFAAKLGDHDFKGSRFPTDGRGAWIAADTFCAPLPGPSHAFGHLLFHSHAPLSDEERADLGRTLTTAARLTTSAIENIEHRNEDILRGRLEAQILESGL